MASERTVGCTADCAMIVVHEARFPVQPIICSTAPSRALTMIRIAVEMQTTARHSPLAIAFADARLRADGLPGDTIGDGMVFFELSNHQNHRLFCTCHCQGTMTADRVAAQLRGDGC